MRSFFTKIFDMTIRMKLILLMVFVTITVITLAISPIVSMNSYKGHIEEKYNNRLAVIEDLHFILGKIDEAHGIVVDFSKSYDASMVTDLDKSMELIDSLLNQFTENPLLDYYSTEDSQHLDSIIKNYSQFESSLKSIREQMLNFDLETFLIDYDLEKNSYLTLMQAFSTHDRASFQYLLQTETELEKLAENIIFTVIIFSITLVILIISFASWVYISTSKDIVKVINKYKGLSSADFRISTGSNKKNELGKLADNIDGLVEVLKTTFLDIKEFVEKLQNLSVKTKTNMTSSNTNIENTAGAVEEITRGVDQQASAAEDSLLHVTELTDKLHVTVESLDMFKKNVTKTDDEINSFSKSLANVSNNSKDVEETNNTLLVSFTELLSSFENIDELSKQIVNIASSIKIVSLNASIEANRAGADGKSFNVVAEEVRNLSTQTSEVSKQILEVVKVNVDKMANFQQLLQFANNKNEENGKNTTIVMNSFEDVSIRFNAMLEELALINNNLIDVQEKATMIQNNVSETSATSLQTSAVMQEISSSFEKQVDSMKEIADYTNEQVTLANELSEKSSQFKM
ncbi:methyl-accepting chemotaxis protein [Cytobacillus sp. IB215316]|uniref:methyl-accepting chemotaxis protein n=1 Tax=Cytobacillus sp. IB215316 TaxID=3097354 RepID=UPI002A102F76|nr:methyl-accepting chemotaxis protein [Cytobacillus sp. IB215316]MDX8360614.1 methyl-accepting chemotaxis protein [Cytobacillus sp. IB215316]